jgi:uncharacterized protein
LIEEENNKTKLNLLKMIIMVFVVLLIPFILFDYLHVRIMLAIVFLAHLILGYSYFKKSDCHFVFIRS